MQAENPAQAKKGVSDISEIIILIYIREDAGEFWWQVKDMVMLQGPQSAATRHWCAHSIATSFLWLEGMPPALDWALLRCHSIIKIIKYQWPSAFMNSLSSIPPLPSMSKSSNNSSASLGPMPTWPLNGWEWRSVSSGIRFGEITLRRFKWDLNESFCTVCFSSHVCQFVITSGVSESKLEKFLIRYLLHLLNLARIET